MWFLFLKILSSFWFKSPPCHDTSAWLIRSPLGDQSPLRGLFDQIWSPFSPFFQWKSPNLIKTAKEYVKTDIFYGKYKYFRHIPVSGIDIVSGSWYKELDFHIHTTGERKPQYPMFLVFRQKPLWNIRFLKLRLKVPSCHGKGPLKVSFFTKNWSPKVP